MIVSLSFMSQVVAKKSQGTSKLETDACSKLLNGVTKWSCEVEFQASYSSWRKMWHDTNRSQSNYINVILVRENENGHYVCHSKESWVRFMQLKLSREQIVIDSLFLLNPQVSKVSNMSNMKLLAPFQNVLTSCFICFY